MKSKRKILIGCCGTTENYLQIAKIGYDYAELSGVQIMSLNEQEFQTFAGIYQKEKFPVLGINIYCNGSHPFIGPDRNDEDVTEYAREMVRRASLLNVKTIGIGAPAARRIPEGFSKDTADAQMRSFLQKICEIA